MDPADIEALIESDIPDARVTVTRPRGVDDDDHLAAVVVSPTFESMSILEQHERVYEAVGDLMTNEIHALELTTLTPEEADAKAAGEGDGFSNEHVGDGAS